MDGLHTEPGTDAVRTEGALHILNREATASVPGWYSIPQGVTLHLQEGLMGYDLVARSPVPGHVDGETVARVLAPHDFEVVDAGTARVELEERTAGSVSMQLGIPEYPFDGSVPPELTIHSSGRPVVYRGDVEQPVEAAGFRFWRTPVRGAGIYNARQRR